MKEPATCQNMQDIREEIDSIDKEIIRLLSVRSNYVSAAVPFKTTPSEVVAQERIARMLLSRREWAKEGGIDPDFIEKWYQDLIQYFISREMKNWEIKKDNEM